LFGKHPRQSLVPEIEYRYQVGRLVNAAMLDFTISGHRSPLSFPEVTNTERYVITSDLGATALDILIQKQVESRLA
jgi:hypothetical protein